MPRKSIEYSSGPEVEVLEGILHRQYFACLVTAFLGQLP